MLQYYDPAKGLDVSKDYGTPALVVRLIETLS